MQLTPSGTTPSDQLQAPPAHIAIIMDGNGRWAMERGLPRSAGHRAGAEALDRVVEAAAGMGIDWLTVFGFSTENWNRPGEEVDYLFGLVREYLDKKRHTLRRRNIRLVFIGDRGSPVPDWLRDDMESAEAESADATGLVLVIAFNYGGRAEIVRAARRLCREVLDDNLSLEEIDEAAFAAHLDAPAVPDPDLVIRTSGECRVSNFLLYQIAYSEIQLLSKHWPDFDAEDLELAVADYRGRSRRFGRVGLVGAAASVEGCKARAR